MTSRKKFGRVKWLLPVGVIFIFEVGIIIAVATTSTNDDWNGTYKPVAEEKSNFPILNDREDEKLRGSIRLL